MKVNGREIGDTPVEMLGHIIKRSGGIPADARKILIERGGFTKAEIQHAEALAKTKLAQPKKTRTDALSALASRMRKGK